MCNAYLANGYLPSPTNYDYAIFNLTRLQESFMYVPYYAAGAPYPLWYEYSSSLSFFFSPFLFLFLFFSLFSFCYLGLLSLHQRMPLVTMPLIVQCLYTSLVFSPFIFSPSIVLLFYLFNIYFPPSLPPLLPSLLCHALFLMFFFF